MGESINWVLALAGSFVFQVEPLGVILSVSLLTLKLSFCPCYWGWFSLLNIFIILFNLLVFSKPQSPSCVLEQCYSEFSLQTKYWSMNSEWLLDYGEINIESESKHLETFRAIWYCCDIQACNLAFHRKFSL